MSKALNKMRGRRGITTFHDARLALADPNWSLAFCRLNIPAAKTVPLGDDFIVVLVDPQQASKAHQIANLLRVFARGAIVWTIGAAAPLSDYERWTARRET
jgi:hypothetical protein